MTVVVATALLIGAWLLTAAPAGAHALVVGSNPQAATRIAHAPAGLRVSFSEAVRPLGQALTVQGPDGQVRLGPVRHPDGRADVLAAALPKLADGSYVVSWRIVSVDDGHLQAGSFSFAVGAGSGPVASAGPPQLPSAWQVAGRWLENAGVLLLVGLVATALSVWRRPGPVGPDEPRYRRLGLAAAVIAAVGLLWQVAAGAATSGGLGPGAVGAFLAASPSTVRRMLVEVVLLAGAAALIWWAAKRGRRPGLAALVLSGGAVVTVVLGAHATGQATRWLFVPLEVVHLLAVGTWIGGLVVLVLTVRRAGIEPVRRFSVLALRVVLVVAVTGLWQGLAQVSSRAALADTDYGRILAVKVAVFLVVVGLAAMARFRLLPRASATSSGMAEGTAGVASGRIQGGTPGGLRRLLAVEASCGAVVVVVAALLANTVPAGEVLAVARAGNVRGGPQTQVLPAGPLRLRLSLEPGMVGRNLLQVQVTDRGGRPVGGLANVYLAIADAAGRVAPATANATRVGPATYRAATDVFSLPGTWRVGAELPGASADATVPFAIAAGPAATGPAPPDPADAVVLGGRAGSALAGLTAMTAGDQLVVRVRGGLGIPPAVAPRPLRLLVDGRLLKAIVQPCGSGCAEAFVATPTRGPLEVEATLPRGTAHFTLPVPLPGPATARLRAADKRLAASRSFRIHEVLDGGLGTVYRTDYLLAAPNRFRSHTASPAGSGDVVWIANDRWIRDGAGPWKHEHTPGLEIRFPARNWSDQEGNVVDLGPARWHGLPVQVLAFIDTPVGAYHRLWVDRANRILHERMDAPGHFMDRDYTNYDASVTITPPQ